MNDPLQEAFLALRQEYLLEAPARLAELRKDLDALRAGEPDAGASLRMRFHRLAGSGGSYGFPEISGIARATEQSLTDAPALTPEDAPRIEEAIAALGRAFDTAIRDFGTPPSTEPVQPPDFSWRVRLVMSANHLRGRLVEGLTNAGFTVEVDEARGRPADAVPPSQRPDFVVISAEPGMGDPYAMAAAWTGDRFLRPRAVVMLETGRGIDRLRAITAGVDAVFAEDRADDEVLRYAQILARIGAPPSSVLVVEADDEEAQRLLAQLEQASIRVLRAAGPASAQEHLDREVPDLILLGATLPEADTLPFARLIRQDPRFHLVPIVVLSAGAASVGHVDALRAGVDDYLTLPVEVSLLLQVVVSRAERGRRVREMVHRDGLTGLLNHATLMAELEHAVLYARRSGEPFAFVIVDLDHFRRINDRHGHLIGDQVLFHVAALLRANIRASDLLGRYGGEEFALILRGATRSGAEVVAAKLHRLIAGTPAEARDGSVVPVQASIGCACYLADGVTAAEVAHAADRALHRAKTSGRNRVEFGEGR